MLAALASERLAPVLLVELAFDAGTTRFWSGVGTLESPDGETWTGTGVLGRIGKIEETAELRAVGCELTLSGIPTDVLDIAQGAGWQNRAARIYFGVLEDTASGREWVGEPLQIFGGRMDQMRFVEGRDASIQLTLEGELIDLERTKARRYTAEDQRSEYSGDAFFDAVPSLQEKEIPWGRA